MTKKEWEKLCEWRDKTHPKYLKKRIKLMNEIERRKLCNNF